MSLSINNNITALNAWRNLKQTDGEISRSMEKLSSGLRINRAADDPAGLVISEKMRAQLNGIDAAVKNSEKAVNMIQTAEAALDKVGKLLVKLRQLAIDTANSGVNDQSMLSANQAELDEAVASISRIADYAVFGTKKLLDGSLSASVDPGAGAGPVALGATFDLLAVTAEGNDQKSVTLNVLTQGTQGKVFVSVLGIAAPGGTTATDGTLTIDGIRLAVSAGSDEAAVRTKILANGTLSEKYTVSVAANAAGTGFGVMLTNKVGYGTLQGVATITGDVFDATTTSTSAGVNLTGTLQIGTGAAITLDQGTGLVMADAKGNHLTLSSTANAAAISAGSGYPMGTLNDDAAVFQLGPNENQTVTVSIRSTKANALGKFATYGENEATVTAYTALSDLTSSAGVIEGGAFKNGNADKLAQAIGLIDKAIDDVANVRGSLGAVQSDNLQVQLDSLRVSYENLQASESTIRDADMTQEMSTYTKYQIMMQAGMAMLSQANQMPNNILQLLK